MPAPRRVVSPRTVIVFVAVGLVATTSYFLITVSLARLGFPPPAANAVGVVFSLLVSYLGHHRITFAKQGRHGEYGARFLITSAMLIGLSTLWTWLATSQVGLSVTTAAMVVAIAYPPCSYLMNALWTFKD